MHYSLVHHYEILFFELKFEFVRTPSNKHGSGHKDTSAAFYLYNALTCLFPSVLLICYLTYPSRLRVPWKQTHRPRRPDWERVISGFGISAHFTQWMAVLCVFSSSLLGKESQTSSPSHTFFFTHNASASHVHPQWWLLQPPHPTVTITSTISHQHLSSASLLLSPNICSLFLSRSPPFDLRPLTFILAVLPLPFIYQVTSF